MLKLITVNIEETKHYNRVLALLTKEKPDIVYLQEAPQSFSVKLTQLGFETSFAPMSIRTIDDKLESTGLMAASKLPFAHKTKYYHGGVSTIVEFDRNNRKETSSYAYIITTINTAGNTFNIATTHVMQTPDGLENDFQIQGINTLLEQLKNEKPHIICGDFNMPRGYNTLYEKVTEQYTDSIPEKYKSSLDRNLHRAGNMDIEQPIFDEYMVDYIFTQPPYKAENIRLEFDVSDHAAVIAHISKNYD